MSPVSLASTTSAEQLLPEGFADLEPFVSCWALETEVERNSRRRSSTMGDIMAFYNITAARLPDIAAYLGRPKGEQHEQAAHRLLLLALSLMEVAPAAELYFQPDVVDAAPAEQLKIYQ